MTDPISRGRVTALREIRAAEASRLLGLLDLGTLPERATRWRADGITEHPIDDLVRTTDDAGTTNRPVLLAALAAECGIHLAGLDDARAVHAQSVIGLISTGGDYPRAVFEFSNNYTDHVTGRLRRIFPASVVTRLRTELQARGPGERNVGKGLSVATLVPYGAV